jgi:antirestriction protein ArdC
MGKLIDQKAIQNLNEAVLKSMKECKANGTAWKAPFTGKARGLAYNMFTNHELTGGNQIIALMLGADDRWATFGSLKKNGVKWRKGSKAVSFVRPIILKKDKDGKDLDQPIVVGFKDYYMINGSDIVDIDADKDELTKKIESVEVSPEDKHRVIEAFIKNTGIKVEESDLARCYYAQNSDHVHMTFKSNFNDLDSYYSVLLHEIGHATGHKLRLNRLEKSDSYAFEELVAELTSMYLSVHFELAHEPTTDNATYLNAWIKGLGDDETFIWKASSEAMKAVKYLMKLTEKEYKKAA